MKIFDRFKNKTEDKTITLSEINDFFKTKTLDWNSNELSEITYYACLKVLSESLGKLSVHLKDGDGKKVEDHDALQLMKVRPNQYMSPSSFKALLEFRRNHYGNAYVWIEQRNGKLVGLHPLDSTRVRILVDDTSSPYFQNQYMYEYLDSNSGKYMLFNPNEILHFKGGISESGIVGKSVRETLATTIGGVKDAQKFLNNLYEKGLTANAVLKYVGDFDRSRKEKLLQELAEFSSNDSYDRIIPIPLGMDLQPLDLKLTDSQFYELKKYTSLQIASAFGVKPNHLNDYEKSSYANSEMQNLTFYVDTLLYILTHYEEELNYKLLSKEERMKGYHFEFNVATILRGDLKTQADSLTRLTQGSIYTINESRQYLGMPRLDDGDVVLVNGSYVDLPNIGKAYAKYDMKGGEMDDRSKE